MPILLFEYGISVLINVWLTMMIVTYIFMVKEVSIDALDRLSFFTKYTTIAIAVAFFVPYIEEMLGKYIEVKFVVRSKDEDGQKNVEGDQ